MITANPAKTAAGKPAAREQNQATKRKIQRSRRDREERENATRNPRARAGRGNPKLVGRLRANRAADETSGESHGGEAVALSAYPARRAAAAAAASQKP
jgi:hypothetical protein